MKKNTRKFFSINYDARGDSVSLTIEYCQEQLSVSPTFVTAARVFDFWHDSSRQKTAIQEQDNRLTAVFSYDRLPLTEQMTVQFVNDDTILWTVDLSSPTILVLDEIKNILLLHRAYRECFIDDDFYKMPSLSGRWQAIAYKEEDCSSVGARNTIDQSVPDLLMSVEKSSVPLAGHCEAAPEKLNTYAIGFSTIRGEKITITPQKPFSLAFLIKIYSDMMLLDKDMERRRKEKFGLQAFASSERTTIPYKKDPAVLFANVPWGRLNKRGVRAGSRWPHMRDHSEGKYLPFPFFLAYATALVKQHGFTAHIIDALADEMTEEQFLQKVRSLQPDLVVMETSAPSFYNDMDSALKLSLEDISVVACGAFSFLYTERFLEEYPYIDAVFVGEYEETALDFVQALHNNRPLHEVKGILYRQQTVIRKTSPRPPLDINRLPWPERDSLPMQQYWDMPGGIPFPSVQMISSRGCPFTCDFCLWPQVLFSGTYRARSIQDCIDEMQFLVEKRGFKSVYWDDDTFNIDSQRTVHFAEEILRRNLQAIPWAMMARADLMTVPLLEKLKRAGLHAVKYGVENFTAAAQRECGKRLNLERTKQIIRQTKRLGIKTHLTFAFGFDADTPESIERTIDTALSWNPDSLQFSILTPFPGTKLFERLARQGRIATRHWTFYDGHHGCVFLPKQIAPERIRELKEYAYRRWIDHERQRRGLTGNIGRFFSYLHAHGFTYALRKCIDYMKFVLFYRHTFLKNG